MALVSLTGARWTQKPPPGTDLDRTHPSCPDHCWPFLSPQGTAQCLAKSAPLLQPSITGDIYANGTSSMVRGRKYGLSVRHTSTSQDILRLTADNDAELAKVVPLSSNTPTGSGIGWTLLLCYRKTDTTNRATAAIGTQNDSPLTNRCTVFLPLNDGVVYFDFAGVTAGTTRLSVSGLTFGDDLWVFSIGLRGMEIWQNGVLRASNAGTGGTRTVSGGGRFTLPGSSVSSDLFDCALVMSWRRQLPAAAIRALSINPWQVFQPRTVLVLAAPVAAAAATKLNTLLLAP